MSNQSQVEKPPAGFSFFTRLTALGFALLILGGNLWLAFTLVGESFPWWLKGIAVVGGGLVFVGGLGNVMQLLLRQKNS